MPAPDGWCVGGGDTSSRTVGDELDIRVSSSGILKRALLVVASLCSLLDCQLIGSSEARSLGYNAYQDQAVTERDLLFSIQLTKRAEDLIQTSKAIEGMSL